MGYNPRESEKLNNLILKHLEETEVTQDLIVYSKRTAFVYGEEHENMDKVHIEEFLLSILEEKGPLTRGKLVNLTNIPRTTLYDVLSKLIMKGKVKKKPKRNHKRGRPKILFTISTAD